MAEKKFRVKFDFTAETPVELSVKQNEFVSSAAKEDSGWLKVKVSRRGAQGANQTLEGLVPLAYLEDTAPPPPALRRPPPPPVAAAPPEVPRTVAEENGECPICYCDWQTRPACVLLNATQQRVCRHFLHKECIDRMVTETRLHTCPLCRGNFSVVKQVPDFDTDPRGWFSCVDFDQNGRLSKVEVLDVLGVLLKVDQRALEQNISTLWKNWDPDHSGDLDFEEFCGKGGLLQYVRQNFAKAQGRPPPPLSLASREEFFTYWDEDGNGTLEKEEIIRAVVKTLNLDQSKIRAIREYLTGIWTVIDPDGSGEVDMGEFTQRDGLGEMLIAYSEHIRAGHT